MKVKVGDRFGYLEVIEIKNQHHFGNSWICRCDCGNELIIYESHLIGTKKRRPTRSCGCRQKKHKGKTVKDFRLYNIWHGMIKRCYNKDATGYERYGDKGVTVCDEWRDNYESFYEWANSNGYREELTLDRIRHTEGYSPDNCRWVDYFEQAHNKGLDVRNKTGVKGVYKIGKNTYVAYISRRYVRLYLGVFDTIDAAKRERKKAEDHYKKYGTLENYKVQQDT